MNNSKYQGNRRLVLDVFFAVPELARVNKCFIEFFQGLAGGTILYVVVFEVLQREKSKEKVPGMVQLLCVILGFSALMLVEILGSNID